MNPRKTRKKKLPPPAPDTETMYSLPFVASNNLIGVRSVKTVKKLIVANRLRAVNMRGKGDTLDRFKIPESAINEFMEKNSTRQKKSVREATAK